LQQSFGSMHPINKPSSEPDRVATDEPLDRLPDRDNPLAWKRATRHGKLGALALLHELADDEVSRYMAVARDQVKQEEQWAAMKIACGLCGVLLVGFELWQGMSGGFKNWIIAGLGLGLLMGYWPWRVLRCRQLWQTHLNAARAEQVRRQLAASA
jgi:hypothetical protein